MGRGKKKLTPKQAAFVREYLKDLNATQAAIRAGYSPRTAQPQSARLLSKVMVQEAISLGKQEHTAECKITTERVLSELAAIAFSDMRELAEWSGESVRFIPSSKISDSAAKAVREISSDTRRAYDADGSPVDTIKLRIKRESKLAALEKLGNYLDLFKGGNRGGDGVDTWKAFVEADGEEDEAAGRERNGPEGEI